MDNRPIGICDSGVGGIVVLSESIKLLPNEDFIYLGDTGRFPYGTKSKGNIINYTKESIEFLINQNVKMVVVACGTASSILPEVLNESYSVPVIGVLEPILADIDSDTKKIGVIATSRTIASGAWNNILKEKFPNLEIIESACPILASLAEAGWTNNEIAKLTIQEYLKPFKKSDISKLILGCTHYPLFKDLIKEELEDVELVDIGEKTALYLKRFVEKKKFINKSNLAPTYKINLTEIDESYIIMINNLLKGVAKINSSDIEKTSLN